MTTSTGILGVFIVFNWIVHVYRVVGLLLSRVTTDKVITGASGVRRESLCDIRSARTTFIQWFKRYCLTINSADKFYFGIYIRYLSRFLISQDISFKCESGDSQSIY